eukprot:scaffold172956_cov40-Prasinocladus_malaysianus.AAC.4
MAMSSSVCVAYPDCLMGKVQSVCDPGRAVDARALVMTENNLTEHIVGEATLRSCRPVDDAQLCTYESTMNSTTMRCWPSTTSGGSPGVI